jgi:hypothetical protein
LKKIYCIKKHNHKNKKEIIDDILDLNTNKFSDKQIKMFHELYLENLRDGLKPKEAMDRAYQIVACFKI